MIPLSFSPTLPQSVSGNGSTSTADKTPSRRTSSNSHSLSMIDLTKKIDQLTMVTNKHLYLTHCPSSQSWAHGCRRKNRIFAPVFNLPLHTCTLSLSLPPPPPPPSLSLSFSLYRRRRRLRTRRTDTRRICRSSRRNWTSRTLTSSERRK